MNSRDHKPTRIVTIGGGSGQFALLSALRDLPNVEISAIVSMTDSGGSTGILRDELGILPPGDVLKCILALSPQREAARNLLLKRFTHSQRLYGHNAGNMLLTMLGQYAGSFHDGILALAEILGVQGNILPVTTDKATLVAELTNGERIYGESAIDIPRGDQREKIDDVFLVPHHTSVISVFPPAVEAIEQADMILMGPGDLYTSLLPNLLVPGIKDAIKRSQAKLVYISNIMTKFGETQGFSVEDFLNRIEHYTETKVSVILHNDSCPEEALLEKYLQEKSSWIQFRDPFMAAERYDIYQYDLLDQSGGVIRHHIGKMAEAMVMLLERLKLS